MKVINLSVILAVLANFYALVAMDLDKPNISSGQMMAQMQLERAVNNADVDWFTHDLENLLKKYPKLLDKKFDLLGYKVNAFAMSIVKARQAKTLNDMQKYYKYISIYATLADMLKMGLFASDSRSDSIINKQFYNDPVLLDTVGSMYKKRSREKVTETHRKVRVKNGDIIPIF